MPTTTKPLECCPDQYINSCCIAFLKLCAYMAFGMLSFVACNFLVTVTALLDADFNHHPGLYEGVPDTSTTLYHFLLVEFTFLALGVLLIRHGLLSVKAFVGVLGSQVFWVCLINTAFISGMTDDDGLHFRCTGDADPLCDPSQGDGGCGAGSDSHDNYDAIAECMTQLDNSVLDQASDLSTYGCWTGLVVILIASAATQWGDVAIDECDGCVRVMRFVGEVLWYLFFPVMSGVFIILCGSDAVFEKPTPLPSQVAAGRRVVARARNEENTQRLRDPNAVDSASDKV